MKCNLTISLSVDCFIDQIAQLFEMKKILLMSQCIDAEEKDVEMKR